MAITKADTKDERIYIRITGKIRDEFDTVAAHLGLKRSALLHSLIVKKIYEAKKETPEIFEELMDKKSVSEKNTGSANAGIPTMTLDEAKADNERKNGGKK